MNMAEYTAVTFKAVFEGRTYISDLCEWVGQNLTSQW